MITILPPLLRDGEPRVAQSSQKKVGRVRPPRVQITYDVEDGGATVERELPMVAGVVSDLSGDSDDPTPYEQRNFLEVEQGGVDRLMKRIAPTVELTVPDEISGDGEDSEIAARLRFGSIDDFSPMGVAAQLPQTAKLLELRQQLSDLYGKVEANDKLDGILGKVLADSDKQAQLLSELGGDGSGPNEEDN